MSFVKLRRAAKVRWAQRQALEELLEGMPGSRQEKFALINQISERFAAVQTGWGQLPEAEMSRHCTPKLTAKHTKLASEIQNEGYTIYTGDLEVSQLRNYRQINQESFSIDFDFSCVAYLMSDNGYVMDGRVTDRQRFIQKLFFDYDPTSDSWKVDFIQEKDVY